MWAEDAEKEVQVVDADASEAALEDLRAALDRAPGDPLQVRGDGAAHRGAAGIGTRRGIVAAP